MDGWMDTFFVMYTLQHNEILTLWNSNLRTWGKLPRLQRDKDFCGRGGQDL